MMHSRRFTRLTALLLALLLVASACSSDSADAVDTSAADVGVPDADVSESSGDEASSSDAADSGGDYALSCDEVREATLAIRLSKSWMTATAAGNGDGLDPDYDATLNAVTTLRAVQDVDGIFGPIRGGLDVLESDAIAAKEGRAADMQGDGYESAALGGVEEVICS